MPSEQELEQIGNDLQDLAARIHNDAMEVDMLARRLQMSSGGGGGGGGFSDPTDISNLWVWLDADAIAQSDGTNVTTWSDQSGNSRDFVSTGFTAPTFETNEINTNMPAVQFAQGKALSYTGGLLDDDATVSNHAHSVVAVVKHTDSQEDTWFAQGSEGLNSGWFLRATGSDDEFRVSRDRDLGGGVTDDLTTTGDANAVSTWHYVVYVADGSSLTLRVDGTEFTGTRGGYNTVTGDTGAGMYLGAERNRSSFFYYFTGLIAEVIAYDKALSSAEITDLESYITTKWGL